MQSSQSRIPWLLNTALAIHKELALCSNFARAWQQSGRNITTGVALGGLVHRSQPLANFGELLRFAVHQQNYSLAGTIARAQLLSQAQHLAQSQPLGLQCVRRYSASANTQPKEPKEQAFDSLELTQEKIDSITDKIPQRPMGVVEGTSYTLIIIAAFGVLAFVLYHVLSSLIFEPTAMTCFNLTLERLKHDPRITVRIGGADDIRAWGTNAESRVARQQIPHQIWKDANGVEHVRIQFNIRGPSGSGLVNADMYKDAQGQWQYTYLVVDAYPSAGGAPPQRLAIITGR